MVEENIHSGHRERTLDRFLENPNSFSEHELLEVLLYYAVKRVDTNELAHRLINAFGNLKGVFNASETELLSIKGVGKSVANFIVMQGKILYKIKDVIKLSTESGKRYSFALNKDILLAEFLGQKTEKTAILFFDKDFTQTFRQEFESSSYSSICVDIKEVAKSFALHKPFYIIVVHNHPSGDATPSKIDDYTTKKLNLLCGIHGVKLADHIVVSNYNAYSYFASKRLEDIKEKSNIDELIKNI